MVNLGQGGSFMVCRMGSPTAAEGLRVFHPPPPSLPIRKTKCTPVHSLGKGFGVLNPLTSDSAKSKTDKFSELTNSTIVK